MKKENASFDKLIELLDISKLPEDLIQLLKTAKLSKRARIVVKHILEHGFITTEELEKKYGYNHPPRAARDVRETGIPLVTFQVESSDGRQIAAYKLGESASIQKGKLGGRKSISKALKKALYDDSEGKCIVCSSYFESRYLQIDHRIPYEISGEKAKIDIKDYMLLCNSCNRAKSWSCEHCLNWIKEKSEKVCHKCYWANPEDYIHIALREIRRLDILWDENEVRIYERLKEEALKSEYTVPEYVKKIIIDYLG